MDIAFERIQPTPTYLAGSPFTAFSTVVWKSEANFVVSFKTHLKDQLRAAQKGRCCYCRRMLSSNDQDTHLEHFIEKAVHFEFSFHVQNLALSCSTCNTMKNASFSHVQKILRKRAQRRGGVAQLRCPVLSLALAPGVPLPATNHDYRWVHPHFDTYSLHIYLEKGWIFEWRSPKGRRTIQGMRLNALARVERRAMEERIDARKGRVSMLVAGLAELEHQRATEVALAIARVIRRRRGKSAP